jgi:hypothetical protein
LEAAKAAKLDDPLRLAVAPVKIRVGGWAEESFALRRSGRARLAK